MGAVKYKEGGRPKAQGSRNVLYYRKSKFGFWISTDSPIILDQLKALGVKMHSESNWQYNGIVTELPKGKFRCVPYQIKAPVRATQLKLERLYDRYLKLEDVQLRMLQEIDKSENEIIGFLKKYGLRLKPNSMHDCQLLSPKHKTRLHLQESWRQIISQEVLDQLISKYPILRSCVSVRKQRYVDKNRLQKILPKLPIEIVAKIMSVESTLSFVQTPLSPECYYCGGKTYRDGRCRRCGLISDNKSVSKRKSKRKVIYG